MRQFRQIRKHPDRDTAIYVANAIAGRGMDYCKSLLWGVHNKYILKLQQVQNTLVVTRFPK